MGHPVAGSIEVTVHPTEAVLVSHPAGRARHDAGITWDQRRNELLWLDTERHLAHRARVGRGGAVSPICDYHLPGRPGAIVPVAGDDGWLVTLERSVHLLRPDGSTLRLAGVAPTGVRLNDAACDSHGRLWACTTADGPLGPAGALYRMEPDGELRLAADGFLVATGIGWSPDGATMYLADRGARVVYSFAFDVDQGELGPRQVLVSLEDATGVPSGLTVDSHGDLWIAMSGGSAVRRHTADGTLSAVAGVPAAEVTSCTFGGRALRTLYVNTGTNGRREATRVDEPDLARLFRVDTSARGQPALPYRPPPRWWARTVRADPPRTTGDRHHYEIVVAGGYGSMIEAALPDFEVTPVRGGIVHLSGSVVDQAALHAALLRLHDLHLEVLELHRLSGL